MALGQGKPKFGSSDRLQHPAIDKIGRSDGVGRLVRTEEDEEIGELFGAREAVDGGVFAGHVVEIALPVAALVGGELFGGLHPVRGQDKARINAVDSYIIL